MLKNQDTAYGLSCNWLVLKANDRSSHARLKARISMQIGTAHLMQTHDLKLRMDEIYSYMWVIPLTISWLRLIINILHYAFAATACYYVFFYRYICISMVRIIHASRMRRSDHAFNIPTPVRFHPYYGMYCGMYRVSNRIFPHGLGASRYSPVILAWGIRLSMANLQMGYACGK